MMDEARPKWREESLRLVKWTGEAPPDRGRVQKLAWSLKRRVSIARLWASVWRGVVDPIGHPQCEEVIEIDLQTGERLILYRRD